MSRVFVAMSGGVDSSVAAALLLRDGHDVTGVTMRLLAGDDPIDGCCSIDGVRSAKRVCDALGIPHYTLEFADVFEREVVETYCDQYAAGLTPNPCIVCNDRVKFSELMRRVALQDADFLATGHYARIEASEGRQWLLRGVDESKDQSYFLYRLTPAQLARTLFPLGSMRKAEVREVARSLGLPAAERPESQETCFVPDDDVRAFVRARRPDAFTPGPIVDAAGVVLGGHDGVAGFTVGQRRGLGVSGEGPMFVTGVDAGTATLTVGPRAALAARTVVARDVVWRGGPGPVAVSARVRYHGPEPRATAELDGGRLVVRFDAEIDAPAPGQALVCYEGDRVLGGGVIEEAG